MFTLIHEIILSSKRTENANPNIGLSSNFHQPTTPIRFILEPSRASTQINQYERGTRAPAFDIVRNIATELSVPPSFFYEPDDTLAELILLLGRMDVARRDAVLEELRKEREA